MAGAVIRDASKDVGFPRKGSARQAGGSREPLPMLADKHDFNEMCDALFDLADKLALEDSVLSLVGDVLLSAVAMQEGAARDSCQQLVRMVYKSAAMWLRRGTTSEAVKAINKLAMYSPCAAI